MSDKKQLARQQTKQLLKVCPIYLLKPELLRDKEERALAKFEQWCAASVDSHCHTICPSAAMSASLAAMPTTGAHLDGNLVAVPVAVVHAAVGAFAQQGPQLNALNRHALPALHGHTEIRLVSVSTKARRQRLVVAHARSTVLKGAGVRQSSWSAYSTLGGDVACILDNVLVVAG